MLDWINTNKHAFPFQTCSSSRSANKISGCAGAGGATTAWQPAAGSGCGCGCALAAPTPHSGLGKQQIRAAAIKTWAEQGGGERKPHTGNNQTKWNSSCSVSSAETPLSHSADNNAQGWDNRKCQLIRQREKQREGQRESVMASSLFTYRLIEKKKKGAIVSTEEKKCGVYKWVSAVYIYLVQVAFVKGKKCRKKYHRRKQIHHFLNLSSITLHLICLDWVTSRGEFV